MGRRAAGVIGGLALLGLCLGLLLLALGGPDEDAADTRAGPRPTGRTTAANAPDAPVAGAGETPQPARRTTGDGRISGRLLARTDRRPLGGQVVRLHVHGEPPREVRTDDRGWFAFDDLPRRVEMRLEADVPNVGGLRLPGLQLRRRRTRDLGDLLLAPAAAVQVQVASSRGEPVPGATVRAFHVGRHATAFSADEAPSPVATARTDGKGAAAFPQLAVGLWNFVVTAPGFARRATGSWELQAGAAERSFHVTLDAATTLGGVVRDADGRPARGVHVLALRRTLTDGPENAPLVSRAVTGADGRYALDDLPVGDLVLWTARPGQPRAVAGVVRLPSVTAYDIELPQGCRLSGLVAESETGTVVAGADVEATLQLDNRLRQTAYGTTDDRGRFELAFPGTGTLVAFDVVKGPLHSAPIGSHVGLRLFAGDAPELDVTLVRGATLEGVVRCDGAPVPGATVRASVGELSIEDTADGNGVYRLEGIPAGGLTVSAECTGYAPVRVGPESEVLRAVAAGQTRVLDLGLSRGQPVSGQVVDPDGSPVAGAEVYVEGDADGWRARADDEGRFELPSATPGTTLQLRARATGRGPGLGVARVSASGPTRNVRVVMRPLTRIRGRVRSATGEPLSSAYVQVAGHGGGTLDPVALEWAWLQFERWSVQPDGTFEHEAPIADSGFVVHAAAAGHAPATSARVTLAPGRTDYEVDVVLTRGDRFSGRVVSAAGGRPVAGAQVRLIPVRPGTTSTVWNYPGAAGPAVAAITGKDGAFVLDHLPEGAVGVEVSHAGFRSVRRVVDLPASGESFVLEPRLDVAGRVVLPGGRPAAGHHLRFTDAGGAVVTTASCDEGGRFQAELPAAGSYGVLVSGPDTPDATRACGRVETGARGVVLEAPRE